MAVVWSDRPYLYGAMKALGVLGDASSIRNGKVYQAFEFKEGLGGLEDLF